MQSSLETSSKGYVNRAAKGMRLRLTPRLLLVLSELLYCSTLLSQDSLSFKERFLHPGKADFLVQKNVESREYNFIWWTPLLKWGAGLIDIEDTDDDTKYLGAFVRPLLPWPGFGELIIGFQGLDRSSGQDHELQAEYRSTFGFGVGGGFVERGSNNPDVLFGKVFFRGNLTEWNYILTAQEMEFAKRSFLGGYVALFDKQTMLTLGSDGEQWRTCFGYVHPSSDAKLRPAFEILWVDNTIGNVSGPQFLFVNLTLGFTGGFLSHPARLGRAMGPTGLEFGNPLAFLVPTWNRQLKLWELGGMTNFRAQLLELPNGNQTGKYELNFFPFQIIDTGNMLESLFIGGFYSQAQVGNSPGLLGGFIGNLSFLQVSLAAEYELEPKETIVILGIIDWF